MPFTTGMLADNVSGLINDPHHLEYDHFYLSGVVMTIVGGIMFGIVCGLTAPIAPWPILITVLEDKES